MKRALVFGDTHIPSRRDSIPVPFFKQIEKSQYDMALVTGDLIREVDMRKALPPLPRCYIVQGNMDYGHHNHHEILQLDDFQVLLLHGTQLRPRGNIKELYQIAEEIQADIGIHGHTHQSNVSLFKDKLFLNPGTISGATGGWSGRTDASFIELEISGASIRVHLYTTDWNVVKTTTLDFRKENGIIISES